MQQIAQEQARIKKKSFSLFLKKRWKNFFLYYSGGGVCRLLLLIERFITVRTAAEGGGGGGGGFTHRQAGVHDLPLARLFLLVSKGRKEKVASLFLSPLLYTFVQLTRNGLRTRSLSFFPLIPKK